MKNLVPVLISISALSLGVVAIIIASEKQETFESTLHAEISEDGALNINVLTEEDIRKIAEEAVINLTVSSARKKKVIEVTK